MVEVSIVIPCLNEEKTIRNLIKDTKKILEKEGLSYEIIVVNNNSTDNSEKEAKKAGAKVIFEEKRGYGNALLRGLRDAKGKYIIMMDADGQHDPRDIPKFLEQMINKGYEFVNGSRFKDKTSSKKMSFLHRYIGNPILTFLFNLFFKTKFSDVHCGFKAISRNALKKINLNSGGMEFASEIMAKVSKEKIKIKEIPVRYNPRHKDSESKLRTFRDGWRHLRFMLLLAPDWLFLLPGTFFLLFGLFLMLLLVRKEVFLFSMPLDIHPLIIGSFLFILGLQILFFWIFSKAYLYSKQIIEENFTIRILKKKGVVEIGSLIGFLIFLNGFMLLSILYNFWIKGELHHVRLMIVSMTLITSGLQIIFSSWMIGIMGLE